MWKKAGVWRLCGDVAGFLKKRDCQFLFLNSYHTSHVANGIGANANKTRKGFASCRQTTFSASNVISDGFSHEFNEFEMIAFSEFLLPSGLSTQLHFLTLFTVSTVHLCFALGLPTLDQSLNRKHMAGLTSILYSVRSFA